MADRLDFYFRQRVTEAELDLAFEQLERADRDLAADIGLRGVVTGAAAVPRSPLPDLTIDLVAPARAYDQAGHRIAFGVDQSVDCSVDHAGLPTEVPTAGQERWLGVFLRFERLLSDERTDGNSRRVFFRRDESFMIVVRQGPAAAAGSAARVALQPDELLVCDVLRREGQTQILAADIDSSRREAFVFASGDAVQVRSGLWRTLVPVLHTAQAAFAEVHAAITEHFAGTARRHGAAHVDIARHRLLRGATVESAVHGIVDDLASVATGAAGTTRVGADAVPGSPHGLPPGTVRSQLAQLLDFTNAHESATSGAHPARAITTTARTGAEYPRPELHAEGQLAGLHTAANDLGARVRDIEGRIVADEWTYPAPKSRVIELGPELAEQDRSRSSEWRMRGAFGFSYLETSRAASTITAALVLPLSRILPFGATRIVVRLLVRPGAARSATANRMRAVVYQNPTLRFTPTPAIGALVPSPEARDNGSSNVQVLTISLPGPLARHAFISLVSGQGDTRQDRFYAAQVGYDDIGPRNHS